MAKIEKIVIDVEGKIEHGKLVVTLEEAKSLKAALDELLEVEEKTVYIPYTPYVQPYVQPQPWGAYPTITWCDTGSVIYRENGLRTTSGGGGGSYAIPLGTGGWYDSWNLGNTYTADKMDLDDIGRSHR